MENYSNAGGYGFWCGKKCVAAKQAAGIPPLGSSKAQKAQDSASDSILAQAALEQVRKEEKTMGAGAIAGIIGASLLGLTLMIVVIRKTRKK
jgi:hypothetical protein